MSAQPRSPSCIGMVRGQVKHHVVGPAFVENVMIGATPPRGVMPRTVVAVGPCCDSTLWRRMKNWPISGACQVIHGRGEV